MLRNVQTASQLTVPAGVGRLFVYGASGRTNP